MSAELWILVATAVLAVVAVGAAVIAVRAVRRVALTPHTTAETVTEPPSTDLVVREPQVVYAELQPRLVEGRLIVPPSQQQVVNTALGRPGVRLSVLAHGVALLEWSGLDKAGGT